MVELKWSDCEFDEITFDSNHKLVILYGESKNFDLTNYRCAKLESWVYMKSSEEINFIRKGSRLTAPLVKYILYDSNGEILSEKIDVNYDIVDEELYRVWPSK